MEGAARLGDLPPPEAAEPLLDGVVVAASVEQRVPQREVRRERVDDGEGVGRVEAHEAIGAPALQVAEGRGERLGGGVERDGGVETDPGLEQVGSGQDERERGERRGAEATRYAERDERKAETREHEPLEQRGESDLVDDP